MTMLCMPEIYVDKVYPPGRASPSDWIETDWDCYRLMADVENVPGLVLHPGDIVNFSWVQDLGTVDVIIEADGSFIVLGHVPADANTFWELGDLYSCESIDKLVEYSFEDADEFPDTLTVHMRCWFEGNDPHRFVVEDGAPVFKRVTADPVLARRAEG